MEKGSSTKSYEINNKKAYDWNFQDKKLYLFKR